MLRWAATPMEWRTLFVIKLECQCVVDPWAFRALRTNTSCWTTSWMQQQMKRQAKVSNHLWMKLQQKQMTLKLSMICSNLKTSSKIPRQTSLPAKSTPQKIDDDNNVVQWWLKSITLLASGPNKICQIWLLASCLRSVVFNNDETMQQWENWSGKHKSSLAEVILCKSSDKQTCNCQHEMHQGRKCFSILFAASRAADTHLEWCFNKANAPWQLDTKSWWFLCFAAIWTIEAPQKSDLSGWEGNLTQRDRRQRALLQCHGNKFSTRNKQFPSNSFCSMH